MPFAVVSHGASSEGGERNGRAEGDWSGVLSALWLGPCARTNVRLASRPVSRQNPVSPNLVRRRIHECLQSRPSTPAG
jgi:hypothetical protein